MMLGLIRVTYVPRCYKCNETGPVRCRLLQWRHPPASLRKGQTSCLIVAWSPVSAGTWRTREEILQNKTQRSVGRINPIWMFHKLRHFLNTFYNNEVVKGGSSRRYSVKTITKRVSCKWIGLSIYEISSISSKIPALKDRVKRQRQRWGEEEINECRDDWRERPFSNTSLAHGADSNYGQ